MCCGLAAARSSTHAAPRGSDPAVTVMTWNIFYGGDFDGIPDMGELFESVQATDFPQRATRLARIIDQQTPHIICLQEVARWETEDFVGGNERDINFITILQNKLMARGLVYDLVGSIDAINFEAPGEVAGDFVNVTWTERIVILAKHSSNLVVNAVRTRNYNQTFTIEIPGIDDLEFRRGFIAADITFRGRKARYVCTHLESLSPSVREAQVEQLITWLDGTNPNVPIILMGDMNALPASGDYQQFIDAGYTDAWAVNHGLFDGPTCCQDADLLNDDSELATRIDHIFVRGDVAVIGSNRAGHRQEDRTPPDGFWPSDHSAVVAKLRLE
jgi:endonuclease/exonuclease/phosphatase family metal-dependent hydrolase